LHAIDRTLNPYLMSPLIPDLVEFADAALAADYTRLRRVGQRLSKALEGDDPEGARRFRLVLNKKRRSVAGLWLY